MLLTHKVKTMLNEKQVIFNTYILMTKMQLNIISQYLCNVNDASTNWGGFVAIARWMWGTVVKWLSWWLRKLLDLNWDGILHPMHVLCVRSRKWRRNFNFNFWNQGKVFLGVKKVVSIDLFFLSNCLFSYNGVYLVMLKLSINDVKDSQKSSNGSGKQHLFWVGLICKCMC